MPEASAVAVSIVVPTRGRPDHAAACVASVLRSEGFVELIVVDQSDDVATEKALAAIPDLRLRYIRTATRGASSGRNVGIAASRGSVIAFTDDDCRVEPDWASRVRDCFATDPEAALICGRVRVPAELQARGFAMGFEPETRELQGRFPPPERGWGIGANLSMRRDVLVRVGVFDQMLGPGAPLLAGEDVDLIYRVLKAGLKVVNASEISVTHLGVRAPGVESMALWRSYAVGTSAALVKHVRMGDATAARLYLGHLRACMRAVTLNLVRGRRPSLVRYTLQFLTGSFMSYRFRIDPDRRQYVPN